MGVYRDERAIDRSQANPLVQVELTSCQVRNIAPGRRRIEQHNAPPDWSTEDGPFAGFEVVSELAGYPGTRFSVAHVARAGDARLLCASRRLLEVSLYIIEQYKDIELRQIEQDNTRELVRRARSAAMTFERAIIGTPDNCECQDKE